MAFLLFWACTGSDAPTMTDTDSGSPPAGGSLQGSFGFDVGGAVVWSIDPGTLSIGLFEDERWDCDSFFISPDAYISLADGEPTPSTGKMLVIRPYEVRDSYPLETEDFAEINAFESACSSGIYDEVTHPNCDLAVGWFARGGTLELDIQRTHVSGTLDAVGGGQDTSPLTGDFVATVCDPSDIDSFE